MAPSTSADIAQKGRGVKGELDEKSTAKTFLEKRFIKKEKHEPTYLSQ